MAKGVQKGFLQGSQMDPKPSKIGSESGCILSDWTCSGTWTLGTLLGGLRGSISVNFEMDFRTMLDRSRMFCV